MNVKTFKSFKQPQIMNKNLFFSIAAGLFSVAALVSCSLESYEDPVEETYTKQFIKTFGLIDNNQDWNMATRDSVTVNTEALANVKVYGKDSDGEYSLLADYDSVSGEKVISFDATRTLKKVLVGSGSHSEIVPLGSTIDFTDFRTRSIITSYGSNTGGISVEASPDDPKILTASDVLEWGKRLPEGGENSSKVTANFHASSADGNTTFTLYLIYWNTGNGVNENSRTHKVGRPNEIGIAYKDDNGKIIRVPIDSIMTGDELAGSNSKDGTYTPIGKVFPSTKSGYAYYRSKGIKVTVPQGLYFGFYILCYDGENEVNDNCLYGYSIAEWNDGNKSYVGTYTDNGKTYLTFEDWITTTNSEATADLNDVVMMFDPAPTILDDDEAGGWILTAEDLGNIDDYDFNDMVISVKHTAGKTFANITALAAGGTLPAQLYRDGTAIGDEFHSWFGDGTLSSSTMINTTTVNQTGKTVSIVVPSDFTMTSYGDVDKMGGFSWVVTREDGSTTEIKAPYNGEAPQMMCLPSTWKWPTERTRIDTAYPDFGKWGKNYSNSTWIDKVGSVDLVLPYDN